MKKLQVLGPGGRKCGELAKRTEEAARATGVELYGPHLQGQVEPAPRPREGTLVKPGEKKPS